MQICPKQGLNLSLKQGMVSTNVAINYGFYNSWQP